MIELGPLSPADSAALLARSAGARAQLTSDDPALLALGDALDGHPLALTLAGERLRFLTPQQLTDATAPTTLLGDALARSLGAAVAGLSPTADRSLARLALFSGPFQLPHSIALLGPGAGDPLDAMQELRDAALLSAEHTTLRLLRPIREHALPRFAADPHADAVRQAFAATVLGWLEGGSDPAPHPSDIERALEQLPLERVATALAWPATRRVLPAAGRMALIDRPDAASCPLALLTLAEMRIAAGDLDGARTACEALLDGPLAAEGWRLRAHVALREGEAAAAEHIVAGLAVAPAGPARARLLMEEALLSHERGAPEAGLPALTEAARLFSEGRDAEGAARASLRRGLLELAAGHVGEGVGSLLRAEPVLQAAGLQSLAATARWYLALVALEIGDVQGAAAHLDVAEARWDAEGDPLGLARVAGLRGVLALLADDLAAAHTFFDEAALAGEPGGRPRWSVLLLEARAILAAREGDPVLARHLLSAADAMATSLPPKLRAGLAQSLAVVNGGALPRAADLRARLLRPVAAGAVRARQRPQISVCADGSWFAIGETAVDLRRRGAPRRILSALVAARRQGVDLDIQGVVQLPARRRHPRCLEARRGVALGLIARPGPTPGFRTLQILSVRVQQPGS